MVTVTQALSIIALIVISAIVFYLDATERAGN